MNLAVERVVLAPGDRLIFRAPEQIRESARKVICETIREAFPGVQFIVLTPGLDVEVARAANVCEAPEA